jgi:hypothetical protein
MGTNLECEVDVEAAVDMIDQGEERDSWRWVDDTKGGIDSRRRSLRPSTIQPTSHEATAQACEHSRTRMLPHTRYSPNQFPVCTF